MANGEIGMAMTPCIFQNEVLTEIPPQQCNGAGTYVLYTVPAGHRAICHVVRTDLAASVGAGFNLYISGAEVLLRVGNATTVCDDVVCPQCVMKAGDLIQVVVGAGVVRAGGLVGVL